MIGPDFPLIQLMAQNQVVFVLYKNFVRQSRRLPHLYLRFVKAPHPHPSLLFTRQFWRIKAFDDVRRILKTDNLQGLREKKIKRMSKVVFDFPRVSVIELICVQDLRKLEAANKQNTKAFKHVLDVAYGRKGKLKRELMEVRYSARFCFGFSECVT